MQVQPASAGEAGQRSRSAPRRPAHKRLPAKLRASGRESSLSEDRRVKWPWGCVVRRQLIESIAAAKARGHCAGHAAIAPRTLCAPWFGKGQ
ncbi:hypothetical protein D8B29_17200 [Verminephrobacter eiseniae]|nr:hypothetical protein [Verminephrobacter eiseniae]MCW5304220.1 hypothetical protein [Verminephrobacter eiseniae]MCW8181271.1 hypothetical protein [Verminephrobacter eiseniae]MCW8192612.1 hypothetical protein [Verminephrobacter eiseniae]